MATALYDDEEDLVANPPAHPVAQLQGPFEESMIESVNDVADRETNMDSIARRTMLLENPRYERVIAGRWKQKPGEKYHPLWKITAQMSFGMHLLAEGMARSEEEVMRILQSHVDDIDGFLERTTEDFDLAQSDVQERLRYLKLPLEHVEVFDRMLEDRTFRMSIVDGNEKIEHIVERTSEAMKDSLKDVQKGMEGTKALDKYLQDLDGTWIRSSAEHEAVFVAMQGNVEGWSGAFRDLYLQGNKLGKFLVQLSEIVAEMQRRAGVVSRRMLIRPQSNTLMVRQSHQSGQQHYSRRLEGHSSSSRPTSASRPAPVKPLPTAPENRLSTRYSSRPALTKQSPSTEKQAVLQTRVTSQTPLDKPRSDNSSATPASSNSRSSSPNNPAAQHPSISELAGSEAVPRIQSPAVLHPRVKNTTPMELPAEVPQTVLLQAPHSSTSRLSTILGLKKDQSEKRVSQAMTTKTLGALLKSPLSGRLSVVPVISGSQDTTSSEATSTANSAETADGQGPRNSGSSDGKNQSMSPQTNQTTQGLGIHGFPEISRATANPKRGNPAFTSHPPEMVLGGKPILPGDGSVKPAELSSEAPASGKHSRQKSRPLSTQHSRQTSHLSSLGEPGPEIDVNDSLNPETTKPTQTHALLDAIAKRTMLSAGQPPLSAQAATSKPNRTSSTTEIGISQPHVAEMEGSSPMLLAPLTFGGPVELEAPQQRLILPPRPVNAGGATVQNADAPSATITAQSDFFKLPTLQVAEGGSHPAGNSADAQTAPERVSMPVATKPRALETLREERSSLPPRLSGLRIARKEAPGHSKRQSDLLEHISYTPPESPIHTRSISEASSNSARILVESRSRSLAPPAEAPAPPAPGGRSMVSLNYAAAGAFEGERKSKHSSMASGSGSSWKKLISAGTTPLLSPSGSRPGSSSISGPPSMDAKSSGVNMMTSGGKDVLWFKGMSRDGVWVSSG